MDTDRFECFLALSDILNYTTASAALHKSQSVLSRQISSLEEELGFELFIRDSKQVSLTNAGRCMREGIRSLKSQYVKLLNQAQEISEGKQGHLTFAVASGETNIEFREMLREYSQVFPDVVLEFVTYDIHDISRLLTDRDIDFVFTVSSNPWFSYITRPDFSYVRVGIRHDYLYVLNEHPLAGRKAEELTLSDFKDNTFLIFDDFEVNMDNGVTRKTFLKSGFMPKYRMCHSLTDLMAGLQSGDSVCIGSNRLLLYNSPEFKKFRLPELIEHNEVMLWSLNNPNPCIRTFVSHVKSYLAARPDFAETDMMLRMEERSKKDFA